MKVRSEMLSLAKSRCMAELGTKYQTNPSPVKRAFHFLNANQKLLLQIALGLIFVGLGIYFIRHERAELAQVKASLAQAQPVWMLWGLTLVIAFVVVQGWMYQFSFKAIQENIRLSTGVLLYLKRNLVSVFLPAGMLTNMLFFNQEVERREQVTRTQIYFASSIFSICSIGSAIVIGLPALFWLFLQSRLSGDMVWGIAGMMAVLAGLGWTVYNFIKKGIIYQLLQKYAPGLIETLEELQSQSVKRGPIWIVLSLSCVIEIIGIAHLYIAIEALGGKANLEVAVIGYAIVLLLLMSSPFLRGIGAIEVTLTYALTLFGFTTVAAISIAFLFRFFEFWAVLALGLFAFVAQRDNLLLRVFPALMLFILGLVNIFSALTPAVPQRLRALQEVLPLDAIHASVYLVLLAGILMLAVAVYLLRGLRNAWVIAVILSAISLLAHLTKGIDWEEAAIAFLTLVILLYQQKAYFIRPDLKLIKNAWLPGLTAVIAVWIFGTIAFFWLDKRHFNADFTLLESFQESVTTFFLFNIDLNPATRFATEFLIGMKLLGGATLTFLALLLLRPLVRRNVFSESQAHQRAAALLEKFGNSSLDYFKTYSDKQWWFSTDGEAFIAFKTTSSYAIVLENPVCAPTQLTATIQAFDQFCRQNGLRSVYYRIPEASAPIYRKMNKKLLPIGEEAVVHLDIFSIQGKENSALRNAVNKMTKSGFTSQVNEPPLRDGFLQQLRAVSDDWLRDNERNELGFSQGSFSESQLKNQTILTIQNPEEKIVGFVNLIPNYAPGEANFDLMRKTADAPNGTMDFLFIKLFEYLKNKGYRTCTIGLVPMSGIEKPTNLQEQLLKIAYERMRPFSHYKSLRHFKEKFNPTWQQMYLAYDAPFDLIYLPNALEEVTQLA